MVVVEVSVRCCQAVDSSSSLHHDLVGIVLRVKYNGVGGDAVPALTAGRVLHKISSMMVVRNPFSWMSISSPVLSRTAFLINLEASPLMNFDSIFISSILLKPPYVGIGIHNRTCEFGAKFLADRRPFPIFALGAASSSVPT